MDITPAGIITVISKLRLNLGVEAITQVQVEVALMKAGYSFTRHHHLDDENIPDFMDLESGIAIEVKLKGQKMKIYRQCARYCQFDQVKQLILVSNRHMKLPKTIHKKPAFFFHIGKAYL